MEWGFLIFFFFNWKLFVKKYGVWQTHPMLFLCSCCLEFMTN